MTENNTVIECKICNREFKSIRSIGIHVSSSHKMSTEEYYIAHIGDPVICNCGKPTAFRNLSVGFLKSCSSACAYHNKDVAAKRENTMMSRYGEKTAGKSDIIKDKIKATNIERHGVEYIGASKDVQNKIKATNKDRYGSECVLSNETIKDNIAKTNIDKYGSANPMKNLDVQNKAKLTNIKNRGVEYPSQDPSVVAKAKSTSISRYGVDVASKSQVIKDKIAQTHLDRHGVSYPMQSDTSKNKSVETMKNKYGENHAMKSDVVKQRIVERNQLNHGVDHTFQLDSVKSKIKSTNVTRYGHDNAMKNPNIKSKVSDTNMEKYGVSTFLLHPDSRDSKHIKSLTKMRTKYSDQLTTHNCEIIDTIPSTSGVKYSCGVCDTTMIESWQFMVKCRFDNNQTPCTVCEPKESKVSFMERELSDYISSVYSGNVLLNDRTQIHPLELDVYLPDLNIAFEFNGLHFHSELYKSNDYHLTKTELCESLGIHLIHVYEDDWVYRKEITKSRINNLLGISDVIYARKCKLSLVSSKETKQFLDDNHIQGSTRSKHNVGLYYNNTLYAIMTFGKSRFGDEYELIRYCNKINTSVVGGASKLFKYFTRSHDDINRIISYADRSWSQGGLYDKLDFMYDSTTSIGYSYVNGNIRDNRMKYQKHKLVALGYDSSKTEHAIMTERKLYRIYDSGNLKYTWTR